MPVTVPDITTKIEEEGRSGLTFAARQFDKGTREHILLNHELKAYKKETSSLRKYPRYPKIMYCDADLCVFHLVTDEDQPLVYGDHDKEVPAWWLIGSDDFHNSGLTLMEFPADEQDDDRGWTRTAILESLGLDGWQALSAEQVAEINVGQTYRLNGRVSIKRHDPDEWIGHHQNHGIDIDWEELEQQRATTATRIPPYLLAFEDAADLVHTFDPLRERMSDHSFQETAYIPSDTTVYIISERSRSRTVTFSEGVYRFRYIAPCRRHTARYTASPADGFDERFQ
jgi:hypothetical protein